MEDFSCLREENVISGNGVVTNVYSNGIEIEDRRGDLLELKIGSCSRV